MYTNPAAIFNCTVKGHTQLIQVEGKTFGNVKKKKKKNSFKICSREGKNLPILCLRFLVTYLNANVI